MHLYALNLQKSSAASSAVYGNFSGTKVHELVVARNVGVELFRPDNTGRMVSVNYTACFGVVRSVASFRLLGSSSDYLLLGSDSGKITIAEYDSENNTWVTLHAESFGKSGCRRAVPGQYLACDPKGRAIFTGAVEKQRFIYVMNRDGSNKLTISSPLEAHHAEAILFSVVGLDVGLENPIFATLELPYASPFQDRGIDQANSFTVDKILTYYELDLGLNHVVRRWSEPVARNANFLLAVPGGADGPGGVLVCGENWLSYKHQGIDEVRAPLPRRNGHPSSRGVLLTAGTVHKQKGFFFLLQSELGDLYKATLDVVDGCVVGLRVSVFDSIPPAVSLCITRTGLLFTASEHGNHYLFQFLGLGDSEDAVSASAIHDVSLGDDARSASSVAPTFCPSEILTNLIVCDEIEALAPVADMLVAAGVEPSASQEQKVHLLTGSGHRSALRTLQHGSSVSELAVSPLPGKANGVWTLKENSADSFDSHIVVSLTASTLVLGVGDTIEEVSDSGFQLDITTLAVGVLRDNSRLQVHSQGVRHIRAGAAIIEWKSPGGREVELACMNSSQLVLSLASSSNHGSELLVFELDDVGQLADVGSLENITAVSSLDIMAVPEGRSRAPFLAVGFLDETVQIMSLEPSGESILNQRALIAVDSRPDSLCFVRQTRATDSSESLLLNVGLQTGVLHQLTVDQLSGSLAESRQRFLGTRSPQMRRLSLHQSGAGEGLLCLSTRAWMSYTLGAVSYHVPLCYEATIDNAASFGSDACPEGLVITAGNSLRILSVDSVCSVFDQQSLPLPYTPRKLARTDSGLLVIIASDQHAFTTAEKKHLSDVRDFLSAAAQITYGASSAEDEEESDEEEVQHMPLRGPVPEVDGKWASCITVLNPSTNKKTELELQNNEAAFSLCVCSFNSAARTENTEQSYIIVGTAVGMTLQPRKAQQYFLRTYQLNEAMELSLVHCTAVEELPLCLAPFRGCLLAGVGKALRMYDLGLKQLLVKCEARGFPSAVARVDSYGDRVFVGDMSESVFCAKYRPADNCFVVFADDSFPRWINTVCALDHRTVAGSDKFGNVFVLRLPEGVDDDTDPSTGSRALRDGDGRSKLVQECHYYVGDMVTSLRKVQFVLGGPEFLLAATISGELHALLPLSSKGDVDFFSALEGFLRERYSPLCGRVHLSYRSYYQPVRNVIDGDLCERFNGLSYSAKSAFSEEQGRSVPEVMKKLAETRDVL